MLTKGEQQVYPQASAPCGMATLAGRGPARPCLARDAATRLASLMHATPRLAARAGFVTLNQLLDIYDEEKWCRDHGTKWREWVSGHDKGDGSCFWNGRANTINSGERAAKLDRLFQAKYPGTPDRPIPSWAC